MILVGDEEHVATLLDAVQHVKPVVGLAFNHLKRRVDPRVAGQHLLQLLRRGPLWKQIGAPAGGGGLANS